MGAAALFAYRSTGEDRNLEVRLKGRFHGSGAPGSALGKSLIGSAAILGHPGAIEEELSRHTSQDAILH
jgi:hypothetical protein